MRISLDPNSIEDYRTFLAIKRLPAYQIKGRVAIVPDEYAAQLNREVEVSKPIEYTPNPAAFDYQRAIASMAIIKRKFCVFADCGLGKTLIFLDFAIHARKALPAHKRVLIISPLMVIEQTLSEYARFYGEDREPIEHIKSGDLNEWLQGDGGIGITNYEAFKDSDLEKGNLGCLILDESSMIKSQYGKYGQQVLRLGKGLEWKLACTGTPAPNDRIEYGNHAIFMDRFPTLNAFLARYFVNKCQTDERWILKPHALEPFYLSLSHWCIFLANPTAYGWKDVDTSTIPPIHLHYHHVELTREQVKLTADKSGMLFAADVGGIVSRQAMSAIAKGWQGKNEVNTNKYIDIKFLVDEWPGEATIIWCKYNKEQEYLEKTFPDAASIKGSTPHEERVRLIDAFKAGEIKILISKPKILGFGLNLQVASRQVFSTLQDSYEEYYQAVKRSNRIGSPHALNVHIPLTDLEEPMVANVMRKARMIESDTQTQEDLFRRVAGDYLKGNLEDAIK